MTELQNLKDLYGQLKEGAFISDELAGRLSPPLLLYPTTRWKEAAVRVLLVGQETLGWDFSDGSYFKWPYSEISSFKDFLTVENSVDAMMHGYKVFEFSRYQPDNYRSPFWRAYRQIRRNFDPEVDGLETAVLWTNLFRMSIDGGSVVNNGTEEEIKSLQLATAGLLKSEIEILKPNVVLFFTGPNYNDTLYKEFEGIKLLNFMGHDPSRTAWLEHRHLPNVSLRTYHPEYLNRGNWELVDNIEQAIIARIS
ncbi:hypothetical protein [Geobacter sulfurreducens]|uniref:hypothetical protein n=1 Tax=Geobacter sulfurreducens TaxID=35554 RepID=UPI0001E34241|nr:hypothetical protein [Geobacter sulfurreducens]ADN78370.1 hypothetical protein KN400_3476 [Geobacter sulfurreducens KN400]